MALVKLAGLPNGADVGTLIHKLDLLEKRLPAAGMSASTPARVEVSTATPPPLPTEEPSFEEDPPTTKVENKPVAQQGQADWTGLIEFVNRKRRAIGSILEHAHPLSLELPQLKIGYPEGSFNLQFFGDSETRASLETLATEYFGRAVRLDVAPLREDHEAAAPTFAQQQKEQQISRQQQLRDNATEHPMIKAAKTIFGGEVEDVRPIDKGFV